MRWKRSAYKVLVAKTERKKALRRLRSGWEEHITFDF
jgi:hypothetical protein